MSEHKECRDVGGCGPDCPWNAYGDEPDYWECPKHGIISEDGECHLCVTEGLELSDDPVAAGIPAGGPAG
jgi:hypothetical protein